MTLAQQRPRFSERDAEEIARTLYGVEAHARALPSDRDQNFRLDVASGDRYVLKVAGAAEERAVLELQGAMLDRLADRGRPGAFPRVHAAPSGASLPVVEGREGACHVVRLVSYLPGVPLAHVRPHAPDLLRSLGVFLGEMDRVLEDFSHPAAGRALDWDLQHAPTAVRTHLPYVVDEARRALVARLLDACEGRLAPLRAELRTSVIHNDANDYNVLVNPPTTPERRVVGLIDFGDAVHSYTVAELAVAAAYAMLDKDDPVAAAAAVVAGYHEAYPLGEAELEALFSLVVMRLCTSVVMSAYRQREEPDDAYLTISEQPAWRLLQRLAGIHPRWALYRFREACGLRPCPQAAALTGWLRRHAGEAAPVVGTDLAAVRPVVFDLSVGSRELAGFSGAMPELAQRLFGRMQAEGTRVGVGRYDEARGLYTAPAFRTGPDPTAEGRTIHLGVDLFLEAGTPVYAPLEGVVHSFADNRGALDYGPTIILEHRAGDGVFYTLYGHLSRASLDGLAAGQTVARGAPIGTLGDMDVNGGWPPHLHFQIVLDLLDRAGDFPGVARASERGVWLDLCPDPNVLLGIPEACFPEAPLAPAVLAEGRRRHVGPALSLSYRRPLTIVRGAGTYLYDETGRAYLDGVNNVCHVGHAHPRVVRAVHEQMAVLNTNTRYLHPNLVRYAERLVATLPEPLRVCFFVNSGSEANDLALRLARTHTGRRDVVVLDGAYHGHLTSLIDISPYKFDGPGGQGAPPFTHVVPMPDPYRGPYRADDPEAGARYAAHVRDATEAAVRHGGVAAFVAEPLLSCGGQVVPPPGFLREAYRHVRRAGGLCIADEVQVGFGRAGTHFWGFETQGVVPDVVTMGKPIGNGHPLGAVVTTAEVAASFANGMEYFNTFGGNPVSCAAGLAVLDVVADEGLQAHARRVGEQLRAGLERLMAQHPVVGDVRGAGLFLGIELVLDREARAPAPAQAAYLVERMKEHGILLSTDGPFHNVIKIKPPLSFSEADADLLLRTLADVLEEDFLRGEGPEGKGP